MSDYLSRIECVVLLIATNLVMGSFKAQDILLYVLSAVSISLGANGLSNFSKGE